MSPSRLVLAMATACCLLFSTLVSAEDTSAPFQMPTQYSCDLLITTADGKVTPTKSYVDGDKIRNEMTMNGLRTAFIVRKDLHQIYQLILNQKMAVEMRYDPGLYKNAASTNAPEGQFESIGVEVVDGVTCSKYKVTSEKTKQVYFFWMDPAKNTPVQMTAADNSMTVRWKNFKVGPQPAALFAIPAGYQIMTMPRPQVMPPPPLVPPNLPPPAPGGTNSGSAAP